MDTPLVLSPSGFSLKNRIFKAAMAESMADSRGIPTEDYFKLYKHWSNVDNILTGHMMVSLDALAHLGDVVIEDTPEFKESMRRLREILSNNVLVAQINHPGRQIHPAVAQKINIDCVSPVGEPCLPGFPQPNILTDEKFAMILSKFVTAADVLFECGFDGISIHAAHGYFLSEVLHPKYMTEKRLNMFVDTVSLIRQKYPNKIICAKMNLGDHYEIDHFKHVIDRLDNTLDFVEISGGSYSDPKFASNSPRHALFAKVVEEGFNTRKLMLTGGFRTKNDFEKVINTADLVGIGRPYAFEDDVLGSVMEGKTLRTTRTFPLIFLMILNIWSYFTGKNFWTSIYSSGEYQVEFRNIVNEKPRDTFTYKQAYDITKSLICPSKK